MRLVAPEERLHHLEISLAEVRRRALTPRGGARLALERRRHEILQQPELDHGGYDVRVDPRLDNLSVVNLQRAVPPDE